MSQVLESIWDALVNKRKISVPEELTHFIGGGGV